MLTRRRRFAGMSHRVYPHTPDAPPNEETRCGYLNDYVASTLANEAALLACMAELDARAGWSDAYLVARGRGGETLHG
jgi:hypothetical protein